MALCKCPSTWCKRLFCAGSRTIPQVQSPWGTAQHHLLRLKVSFPPDPEPIARRKPCTRPWTHSQEEPALHPENWS